ncbi:hypothetical protein [uncultured Nitrosomonas sp.]|uniref:hypothetical protein n=1 Tax=uncultured Nitrosomonas sp. TaxID=156424 RepID=UPI002619FEF0|nr:hypothetical protein [uncultured Nitrosomonas sp.]
MKKLVLVFMVVMLASPAFAVEVAPRISDREIIESLAELKAGQKALEAKMDLRFTAMQEQMDQRFTAMQEQMDQRFTAMQEQMDKRFAAVDQRFEAVDRRLDFIQQLMLVTIAGIFGLIGFIIWDRYSTLRPMDMRLRRLEENLEHDLELQSPEGSKLTRMIHVLRELAKEDRKIASILRSFSLL